MKIPDRNGSYTILFELPKPIRIKVGSLGIVSFPSGFYAYTGSAFGSGGLRARILRHLRKEKRLKWHIDYILPFSRIRAVFFVVSDEKMECSINREILKHAKVVRRSLGSSDCRTCPSHLLWLGDSFEKAFAFLKGIYRRLKGSFLLI